MTTINAENHGTETLEVISDAGKFNQWMYQTIKPYCGGNVLEVGSGMVIFPGFFWLIISKFH